MEAFLDLRQIRYFVAVAEERSFTRAAQRLHISQPPLSQNVKALEDEMGVSLLVRSHLGVTPTDAGLTFLRQARRILGLVKDAVDETVHVGQGHSGSVRIGVVSSSLFRLMPPVLERLRAQLPDAVVTLSESTSNNQLSALVRGELDIGIIHGPVEVRGLHVEKLCSEPMCAVLPWDHPLAGRGPLPLSALAPYDFVLFAREQSPGYFDSIAAMCVHAGFSPKVKHTARDSPTTVRMAALGMGVGLVSQALRAEHRELACFRRFDDASVAIDYLLAWHPEDASELVRQAVQVVRRVASKSRAGR